ncbi:beta-lactamase/transpeptidase-like protein [Circinella umbellata]|nr:beta-lactamase/transpeptidase-like protein [Circinella umbellata]
MMTSKAKEKNKSSGASSSIINKQSTSTKLTSFWTIVKTISVTLLFGSLGVKRYLSQGGPFTPLTCSVFGYKCERKYDVPYHGGYVHEDYVAAEQVFKENFYAGEEVGAGVSAFVNGELVLNIQGGWQNFEEQIPYTENTLQMVFSSTKVLAGIVVARFVDQGILSYDEKITTYWPEFGQGNKENVTLGDLMLHAGGVGYLDVPITSAEAEDPERWSNILASQPHNFGGIRTRSYNSVTYGWYINEILKRTANTTVHNVAVNELNKHYNIEWNLKPYQRQYDDRIPPFYPGPIIFQIARLVELVGGPVNFFKAMFEPNDIGTKSYYGVFLDGIAPTECRRLAERRIETPAISGYTNAYSIAKLAAMMANGGKAVVDGEPDLLSPEGFALSSTRIEPPEIDLVMGKAMPQEKGGWGVFDEIVIEGVEFSGWSGVGGSVFIWNQEHKIGFGYVMNANPSWESPDKRSIGILRQIVKQALIKK